MIKIFRKLGPYLFGKRIEKGSNQELTKPTSPPPPPRSVGSMTYRSVGSMNTKEKKRPVYPNRRITDPISFDEENALVSVIQSFPISMSSSSVESPPESKEDHNSFEGGSSGGGGAERSWEPDPPSFSDTPSTSND